MWPFFRSVCFYGTAVLTAYLGSRFIDSLPTSDLVYAILPGLLLFVTVDLWSFITRGTIDGTATFAAVIGRRSITQAGDYVFTVLPCDVWEDGMMTLERYGRHGSYAIRKFWQRNNLDKLLASRGGGFALRVVARHTIIAGDQVGHNDGLGIYSSATIRTSIKYIDDDQAALFLEQRFCTGGEFSTEAAAVSLVKVRVVAPSDPTLFLPKEVCEGRTSDLVRHVLSVPRKTKGLFKSKAKTEEQNRAASRDVAVLSSPQCLLDKRFGSIYGSGSSGDSSSDGGAGAGGGGADKKPSPPPPLSALGHFVECCAATSGRTFRHKRVMEEYEYREETTTMATNQAKPATTGGGEAIPREESAVARRVRLEREEGARLRRMQQTEQQQRDKASAGLPRAFDPENDKRANALIGAMAAAMKEARGEGKKQA